MILGDMRLDVRHQRVVGVAFDVFPTRTVHDLHVVLLSSLEPLQPTTILVHSSSACSAASASAFVSCTVPSGCSGGE